MTNKYKVITLCGSVKFENDFKLIQEKLSLEGNIVLTPTFFKYQNKDIFSDKNIKTLLDNLHKQRIDLSDEIFVINKNGYIGESTSSEIEYAKKTNKTIKYLEN